MIDCLQDNEGDFGVLVAQWTGHVKKSQRTRGDAGYCQLEYLNLRSKKSYTFDIKRPCSTFNIDEFQCDLTFGSLHCDVSEENLTEKFMVSLSATVLYLLVQPIPGKSVEDVQAKWDALPSTTRVLEPPVLANFYSKLIKCCGKIYYINICF